MATAAGAVAGVGFASLLGGAVTAASNLNETVNKSNVIFGNNARQVRAWSQDSARSFGLSQQAALDAASGLGNMLTQLGYTADAAAATSENTVKLAADLGSFNNLDTGDVLERIGGALRGEYDSLQLLIPNINAARVEQEAMAETGKANADALTAQEKAAAVLAIVQRDGAAAADDFAETSDGLANSQKILTAEWQDAQAKLGALLVGPMTDIVHFATGSLIPAFETIVDVTGDAVDIFADLPGPLQAALGVLGGVALLRGPLSGTFETIALQALYAKDAIAGAATNVGLLKSALGKLAGAAATLATITVLAKAIGDVIEFTNAGDDARETVDNLSDSLAGLEGPQKIDANKVAIQQLRKELEGYQDILDDYENESILHYLFIGQFGASDITDAKEAVGVLTDEINRLEGESATAAQAVPLLGGVIAETGEQAAASQEALDDWLKKLQGIAEGFVEPLSAYQDLLAQKQQAEQESAQATADATDDASDSWEDYANDVSVSLDEYAQTLQDQLDAQANWRDNLGIIAQEASADVANYLAEMGDEGVDLVAQMANGTDAEVQRMADAIRRDIQQGGADWTAEMQRQLDFMAAAGKLGANATVGAMAAELELGTNAVRRIANTYGVELAGGVNPILTALGKGTLRFTNSAVVASVNANGNLFEDHSAQIAPGGAWRVWAEPETGGEAYIPLAPSKRGRSMDIWRQVGDKLGVQFAEFANGGFVSTSDVPKPRSTAPYGVPLSTAGDATMQKAYDETVAWLTENLSVGPMAGSGVQRWLPVVLQSLALIGQPSNLAQTVLRRMQQESGGNPSIVNRWDSNWLRGTPSVGLMQVIGPTYSAYKDSRRDVGPYLYGTSTDGLSNILASEHYALARYGSLSAAYNKAGGYDNGGLLMPGYTLAYNGTGKPENVRTAEQESALSRTTHIVVEAHTRDEQRIAKAVADGQRIRDFLHG